jgi:hypothetical protein
MSALDYPAEKLEIVVTPDTTRCALVVPHRLAEAIGACHDGQHDLKEMGRRARAYAEQETDRSIAVDRYRAVLDEVGARH